MSPNMMRMHTTRLGVVVIVSMSLMGADSPPTGQPYQHDCEVQVGGSARARLIIKPAPQNMEDVRAFIRVFAKDNGFHFSEYKLATDRPSTSLRITLSRCPLVVAAVYFPPPEKEVMVFFYGPAGFEGMVETLTDQLHTKWPQTIRSDPTGDEPTPQRLRIE